MQVTKISATARAQHGKGAARRLRAEGKIPAVTYGKGEEAKSLAVSPEDVADVLTSAHGKNSVIDLEVDGEATKVMIGEYQYHPLSRELLHADFVKVDDATPVEVKVPLKLTGKAKGIVMGGKLRQVFRDVPVKCAPSLIPVEIVHDITELDVEQNLSAGELALPEGVEVLLSEKRTVATIAADRRAKNKEADDEASEEETK